MTSKGTAPVNLDLFLRVEEEVIRLENKNVPVGYPVPFYLLLADPPQVGFWHIPRAHNEVADQLAKDAAVDGTVRTL
jgi:ribonuclease HI